MHPSRKSAFVSAVGRAALIHNQPQTHACNHIRSSTFFVPFRPTPSVPSRPISTLHLTRRRRLTPTPFYASASAPQQETDWNEVKVISVTTPCKFHTLLSINVGTTSVLGSLTDAYRVPGMYVQLLPAPLDTDKKAAFLAISSPPTITGIFEFLIKDSESTDWISSLKPGDSVFSTPVKGPGFRLKGLDPQPNHILLFATGSGIAPIRAAIESPINGVFPNRRQSVTLFYGARTPDRMSYMDKFDEWRENGVDVVPVISRPGDAEGTWDGRTGYVQHALDDLGVKDPGSTAALLCGVRGMTEEVSKRLKEAGVPESNILFNF